MFGKRREVMSQEINEPTKEKPAPPASRPKKEVELFPPIAERNQHNVPSAVPEGGRLGTRINMFEPMSFEDALEIVEALRSRNATTISLDKLPKTDANRLIDFVAGASAALDGDFHKMTEQVFLFCPANIRIVGPSKAAPALSSPGRTSSALNTSTNANTFSLDALFPDLQKEGSGSFWTRQ